MNVTEEKPTLYHRIADVDCASVRKWIVEHGISEKIQFRNVDASEEGRKKLESHTGGTNVPTLEWRGKWIQGREEVQRELARLKK